MAKPVEVGITEDSLLFIKYSDGICGEISLTSLVSDEEYPEFKNADYLHEVKIDPLSGDPTWPNGASLCRNAIYKQLELKNLMKNLHIDINKL